MSGPNITSESAPPRGDREEQWERFAKEPSPEQRNAIILQNIPLVRYVIGRINRGKSTITDSDDLFSEGCVGLVKAVDRFDPSRGVQFASFAVPYIRGAIIDSFRKTDRLTRRLRGDVRSLERARERLWLQLGREPDGVELAAALGVSLARYRDLEAVASCTTVSLDRLLDRGGRSRESLEPSRREGHDAFDLSDLVGQRAEVNALMAAIAELPDRERLIIVRRYKDGETFSKIARDRGLSESRIHQLHRRALEQLRASLESGESDGAKAA